MLSALAAATIVAPPATAIPAHLEGALRHACAGAWRAVEVLLAGDVLRGRLGKTRDTFVRDGVEGVLGLFGNLAVRPGALGELRAAREAGAFDGPLDVEAVVASVLREGAAAVGRAAIATIRAQLAAYPELAAALGEHEVGALLVDAARAVFRHASREPLAAWAIGPTGAAQRDRALAAFAELAGSVASVEELDTLIAMPIHLDENVQFTVYRPRAIDPGRWHALLAFAHLADRRPGEDDAPDPVEEVKRQAEQVLGDRARAYQPVTQDAASAVPSEGELTFVPELPGIEVNPPRRSFLWLESVHREEFRIRAGRELDGRTIRGRLTVFLGHIAIAEVALTVKVDVRPEPQPRREVSHARAYRKIFASYSHKDVAIVNQFETYARALGDEYLRDWIHLRTGEVWNDRLRQLIENADAFQLFWSWNSMHSKFVRQEYEHALALNRPSFVRPTYWEEPMPTAPGMPPEPLLRLHFQKIGGEMIRPPAAAHEDYEPTAPRKAVKQDVETAVSRPRAESVDRKLRDDDDLGPPIDPPLPDHLTADEDTADHEVAPGMAFERESVPIRPSSYGGTSPPPAAPAPAPSPGAPGPRYYSPRPPTPGRSAPPRPSEAAPAPPAAASRVNAARSEPSAPRKGEAAPRPTEAAPVLAPPAAASRIVAPPPAQQRPAEPPPPLSPGSGSVPIAQRLAELGDSSRTDKHAVVALEEAITEPRPISPKAIKEKAARVDAAKQAQAASRKGKKKQAEIVEAPAKIPATRPQSPPPMPAPSQPAPALPPVSPYAQTVPQQAYKEDPFGAINAIKTGVTPEQAEASAKRPLLLAIVVVLLVIAAVVILALR